MPLPRSEGRKATRRCALSEVSIPSAQWKRLRNGLGCVPCLPLRSLLLFGKCLDVSRDLGSQTLEEASELSTTPRMDRFPKVFLVPMATGSTELV